MRQTLALLLIATAVPMWAAQPVRARHGMVVSRERHATETGLQVLKNGGNAIDAAVAVGFALAVTHPSAGNIGGGGFMLIRLADGRTTFIDFRERAPLAASRNMYLDAVGQGHAGLGYRLPRVRRAGHGARPGVRHKKYGKKPWAELVHPAVELAAKGFPVSYALAQSLRGTRGLSGFPESKRIFLKDGKFYEAGELLVQPELARTLERIEKLGSKDFYEGETARLLAKDMAAHGGLITEADLKKYAVHERAAAHRHVSRLHHRDRAAAEFGRGGHSADARHAGRHGLRKGRRRIGLRDPLHDGGDAPLSSPTAPNIWAIPISSRCR